MAAWRYKISKGPCNILYLWNSLVEYIVPLIDLLIHDPHSTQVKVGFVSNTLVVVVSIIPDEYATNED